MLAAYGIIRDKGWGWALGLFISVVSFISYILSRSVGLPLIPAEPNAWLEPMRVASLIAEGSFISLFTMMKLLQRNKS